MRTSENIPLPVAEFEYSRENEQRTRRTVELAISSLRSDVVVHRDQKDGPASLALKRHQFLLMGA